MRLRDLGFLALGAVLAVVAQGLAQPELSLELGQCRFHQSKDGNFFHSNLPTEMYLRPACGSLAFSDRIGESAVGYRVAYLATGQYQARGNLATTDSAAHRGMSCDATTGDGCLYRFDGAGRIWGVSAGLTAEHDFGPVRAGALAGLLFFNSCTHASAKPIDGQAQPGDYEACTRPWNSPSAMVGASLRYGNFFIAARKYIPTGHRSISLTDFSFSEYVAGVAFDLR